MTTTPTPEQCSHEAWEARSGGRKCSDCGDWLDDTARTAPTPEPVAWLLERRPDHRELSFSRLTPDDAKYGWTETPLYARAALAQMGEG